MIKQLRILLRIRSRNQATFEKASIDKFQYLKMSKRRPRQDALRLNQVADLLMSYDRQLVMCP